MAAEQRPAPRGDTRATANFLADRLDALAFGLLAVMPLGMALINRSAQPILIAAMVAALAARASAGDLKEVGERIASVLRRPLGLVCLAYLAFALVSISWGHHPKTSISMFAEVGGSAGAALVLHAALARPVPQWAWKLAVIAMALGCLSILGELASGMTLRGSLGARNFVFIFKRSVTAMLILFWPIAAYLWLTGRRPIAVALLLLFAIATYAAQSSGALMGLAAGLALAAVTVWSRRIGSILIAAGLLLALVVAPVLGDAAERILPARMVERLHFAHADQRLDVWQSFGEVVKRRPIGGAGFGTSTKMAQEPVAQEVPAERRVMLGAWHPHNGYLQIWAETGAIGALLAGAALLLLALGIGRLPPPAAVAAAGLVASAAAVMLVGHGIWQGWWSAVIGTAAFWLARLPEAARDRA